MKTRILITGGAGYIGSVLTKHLLEQNYAVTVLDDLRYKQSSLLHLMNDHDFQFELVDVRDRKILQKLVKKHDIIIPLAAIVGMSACNANGQQAIDVNFHQIEHIIGVLSKDQKIILPNTNSQYGSSDTIITEESPFKPLSLYAQTKCDAENVLLDSGNGIALRLATVFGVSPRMRLDLLVNNFVYKAMNDGYLVLFESHFKRNYIHIQDIARTFEFMIRNYDECNNQAFNVGLSEANLSKMELAELIKEHIPSLVIMESEFKEDFDKRNYIVSNEKLENKGWVSTVSLEYGIIKLIEAYPVFNNIINKEFTNL